MHKMNVLDASWLLVESPEAPMQVGQLLTLDLPPNASENWLRDQFETWRKFDTFYPPFNLKPRFLFGLPMPRWKVDNDLDLDYHFRHSALPKPGGERELGILVSRLHSHPLDLNRPLWEFHLIEGLENNRWAIYAKCHHSLIDGVSGVRMLQRMMTTSAKTKNMPPPWGVKPAPKVAKPHKAANAAPTQENALRHTMDSMRGNLVTLNTLRRAFRRLILAGVDNEEPLMTPFKCPPSILNGRIGQARRFATQHYDLPRMKKIAKAANCSLNDIVLAISGTALRRFLKEINALPKAPMTAGLPVNIRPANDQSTGTAISFIMASLATDIADPLHRLNAIKESTHRAKAHLSTLPSDLLMQYTALVMAPMMIQLVTGLGGRMRSVFNITISNVPGPKQTLYYNGAELIAVYPLSLIPHGQALNITCLSYADTLNFGFTGCRDSLPSLQKIAVYTGDALDELEKLLKKR